MYPTRISLKLYVSLSCENKSESSENKYEAICISCENKSEAILSHDLMRECV